MAKNKKGVNEEAAIRLLFVLLKAITI